MDTCQLCGKHEDERNTQEQMGYTICLGCDGLYSDEELASNDLNLLEVITMDKPKLSLRDITQDCELAIGEVFIEHMPLAESGDVDPLVSMRLEVALNNAIKNWWRFNASHHYDLDEMQVYDD
jgi:hypothetical protein